MIDDRIRWNLKYKEGRKSSLHRTLLEFYHLAKGKKALDIACGTGENAIFLAKKGFDVIAFDVSDIAIKIARKKAKYEKVKVKFKVCDALKFSFGEESYDLILNFFFLERKIFLKIIKALKKEGILIFETYNEEHTNIKPNFNQKYLLKKGELLKAFYNLEILYYCEVRNITTLIARKP